MLPDNNNTMAPYSASLLAAMPSIAHGFFSRKGGVSSGIYASCNCGWGSADLRENVRENRSRVAASLGAREPQLLTLYQIHSADVVTVTDGWTYPDLPKADAMVTNRKGIALGTLGADCVPVLFADENAGVIGVAHAGWKGATGGVIGNTVAAMKALGARSITAAIGPAIGQVSYEVQQDFYQNILTHDSSATPFFMPSAKAGRWQFDIKGYVYALLQRCGIEAINMLENNTYLEENAFFSFRRTTHRSEPDYGRQISAILLKDE